MLRKQSAYLQYASTDCDSCEERDLDFSNCKTNPLKHKTELCKTYSEMGYCNYGSKCRFAHGKSELIQVPKNVSLKQRKCNNYWGKGHCNYGIRCQFGHSFDPVTEDKLIFHMHLAAYGAHSAQNDSRKTSKLFTNLLI